MATDPERPIEKLLHATARKRRDETGAPFKLHPATRRLLQGEAARRFAKPANPIRSSRRLLLLWPRFAWGLGIFAVLVAAGFVFLPSRDRRQSETFVAKNELAPAPAPVLEPQIPSPPVPQRVPAAPTSTKPPALTDSLVAAAGVDQSAAAKGGASATLPKLDERSGLARLGFEESKTDQAVAFAQKDSRLQFNAGIPQGISTNQITLGGTSASLRAGGIPANEPASESENLHRYGLASSHALSLPSPAQPREALSSIAAPPQTQADGALMKQTSSPAPSVQNFVRTDTPVIARHFPSTRPSASFAVLASFQLEQSGPILHIHDADGSIYAGALESAGSAAQRVATDSVPTGAPSVSPMLKRKGSASDKTAPSAFTQTNNATTYAFRVAGTNLTLKQNVIFTGVLAPTTNSSFRLPSAKEPEVRVRGFLTGPAPNAVSLPGLRISGQALIGGSKPIEIEARSAQK